MTESIQIQLKKGALELCVLALLARRESYAYEIASTLAESNSGPPRKYYRLTSVGRAAFIAQKREWRAFTDAVNQLLGET